MAGHHPTSFNPLSRHHLLLLAELGADNFLRPNSRATPTTGAPHHSPYRYHLPLAELGGDFYDELKSVSSGYASFDYEESEYRWVALGDVVG